MTPPLTVMIVTLNRRDLLELCLWYLYETSTAVERNLFIWDNASEDDTPDFLGTLVGWPGVRVFRSKTNAGTITPKQRMLSAVETPYVFTLDDDIFLLNRGWASGIARILDADPSVGQIAVGPAYHPMNDYGIAHADLDRPFFRAPPYWPADKADTSGAVCAEGSVIERVAGEAHVVPGGGGTRLPFAVSGNAAAWRTDEVRSLPPGAERNALGDLTATWGIPLTERSKRQSTLLGYGMLHPSPGPIWHLGRGERYWERRCELAEEFYLRSGDEQRKWLEIARAGCGWGRPLEDPDEVLS